MEVIDLYKQECCGQCEYCRPLVKDVFVCCNPDSDYYSLETEYQDTCEEFENR
jgi:hypothetical protein